MANLFTATIIKNDGTTVGSVTTLLNAGRIHDMTAYGVAATGDCDFVYEYVNGHKYKNIRVSEAYDSMKVLVDAYDEETVMIEVGIVKYNSVNQTITEKTKYINVNDIIFGWVDATTATYSVLEMARGDGHPVRITVNNTLYDIMNKSDGRTTTS